jgi:haloacetate dehalogenase
VWREHAEHVEAKALDCGHFLPEEAPDAVLAEFARFFGEA